MMKIKLKRKWNTVPKPLTSAEESILIAIRIWHEHSKQTFEEIAEMFNDKKSNYYRGPRRKWTTEEVWFIWTVNVKGVDWIKARLLESFSN